MWHFPGVVGETPYGYCEILMRIFSWDCMKLHWWMRMRDWMPWHTNGMNAWSRLDYCTMKVLDTAIHWPLYWPWVACLGMPSCSQSGGLVTCDCWTFEQWLTNSWDTYIHIADNEKEHWYAYQYLIDVQPSDCYNLLRSEWMHVQGSRGYLTCKIHRMRNMSLNGEIWW